MSNTKTREQFNILSSYPGGVIILIATEAGCSSVGG